MEEKKSLLIVSGASVASALGLGVLIYFQSGSIAEREAEAEQLTVKIAAARETISKTPELESQVILRRETDDFVSGLLPSNADVTDFARALSAFGKDSGVNITKLSEKNVPVSRAKQKADFRKVGYSINFEADAFQMLSLLDLVESHERFMQVPSIKLTGAPRKQGGTITEAPLHSVAMEIETFVYEPQSGVKPAKIENYERKAELLAADVAQRRRALEIPTYDYQGVRNRRDPWVDPRVPIVGEGDLSPLPIPEQLALAEQLEQLGDTADSLLEEWRQAPNLIAEMQARKSLEEHLADLEVQCANLEDDQVFSYFPAQRRFELVVERLETVRDQLDERNEQLPDVEELRGTIQSIYAHMENRDYQRAQEAYENIQGRLPVARRDPLRRPLAERLEELGLKIATVLEFQGLAIEIEGYVDLGPGKRVVLIEGATFAPRELVRESLILDDIHEDRVDFIFKNLRISVPIEGRAPESRVTPR